MREKQKQCIVTCEVGLVEFQRVILSSYFFINIIVLCLYITIIKVKMMDLRRRIEMLEVVRFLWERERDI
jgi:hypothetical protein